MISRDEIKREVIRKFDEQHTDNLLDLEKCYRLQEQYENDTKRIKTELNLNNNTSTFVQAISVTNKSVEEIHKIARQIETDIKTISNHLKETNDVKTKLENYFNRLNTLECTIQYIKIVQSIEMLCEDLQKEIENKDDERCATIFANITEIARHLANTTATHLRDYLKETVTHWYNILKKKFTKDFDEALKVIKWPFVNVNFSLEVPLELNIKKVQIIVEYLLQIDLPDELKPPSLNATFLSDFPHLSLPMQLLVEPLRKRFLYHFYGTRQTNRVDKPEWYFTKVLSWIRDHTEFVEKWVQPVIDKMGLYHIDAKIELMRGLVQLAVEKLYTDLPTLQYDDFTFSHCIDEALGFDKELKESYDYPATQPGVLTVLTQGQVFIKWMSMEKKCTINRLIRYENIVKDTFVDALEKMDAMLSETFPDAFQALLTDVDDQKITPCAEIFVTLLQTITERYECLPQPGHRLQFLELQLELLDDFRVRLLQLVNAEEGDVIDSKIATIANTVFYIENVLIDWGSMLHFLNLYYYKSRFENVQQTSNFSPELDDSPIFDMETDSVFAEIFSLYRHMRKDLLCTLTESVISTAKARSQQYRHEFWSKVKVPKDMRSLSLTPSACPIFEILATRLHQLQKSLTSKLFAIVWRSIAKQIDTFLFEDLVLENRFSEGGALQFKYDITRNSFPLFSQFTDKPDSYFTQLNEACCLLNISKGSALLLRETLLALEGATGVEDRRGQALAEVGVYTFGPKLSVTVLNRRADITVDRISID